MNRLVVCALLAGLWPASVFPQAAAGFRDSLYTLENPSFRIEVDAAAGARIRSWLIKPSGRELISLWKGAAEIGGALDDRAFFTAVRYDASVVQPGPEVASLRFESKHPSGLSVLKILTARKDAPALEIYYEFRNGTQTPQRLFVRNFFLPGGKPQTDNHLYWVNADPAAGRKPVLGGTDASQYYTPADPAFAALWDKKTGDGILAVTPGADKFYFWRDSREFPTFEWLYADVPPGKVLQAHALLVSLESAAPPDWKALIAAHGDRARKATLHPLPGWVNETARFAVTDAERQRGFWLSIGADEYKQRLPETLPFDLPLAEDRFTAVTLNILKDFEAPVRLNIPQSHRQHIRAYWETPGDDRRELLDMPAQPVSFKSGATETLWLQVSAPGREASSKQHETGPDDVPMELVVGDVAVPVALRLRVWPVAVQAPRPFHVRGYYGGYTVLTGGFDINEKNLRRLDVLLKAYADIGGNVLDWTCAWNRVMEKIRIAGTDDFLAEVARKNPERIDLERLPQLDFSAYDPWFEAAKRHGVTRLETYLGYPTDSRLQWALLDPAVGKGRVKAGTPEAGRVIVWFYREMKRHFAAKGFDAQFCKISDEISPEHIPPYIAAARLAREAGWRPFTTITGMIARTAEHIRQMNPWCDQWQLGFGSKDEFLRITRARFALEPRAIPLDVRWGEYRNGGAEATWGAKVFGPDSATGISPETVERLELCEDGVPLRIHGDSPWGNKERGLVITAGALKQYLYVSPRDGADPAKHRYELRLTLRRESPDGEPLVSIDPADEVWCYGGSSKPYRSPYHAAWVYPVMTLHHGLRGYGLWAFCHWQKTENIVWLDEDARRLTVSPAYCGYRDGWRDALLFSQAAERPLGENAALRVGRRTSEVYDFTTVLNAADPLALNAARREVLQQLARPGTNP